MNYKDYFDVAKEAAIAAEKIITNHFNGDLDLQLKSDRSPVTIADKEAEKAIKTIIHKSFPDHSFLGEESGTDNKSSEFTWIVDPIDGTKNYTRGIPLFATQIAMVHQENVVVAVSLAPEMHEMVSACKGMGAFLNGSSIRVSDKKTLDDAYVTYGNLKYFKKHGLENNIDTLVTKAYYSRGIGDAWSYHLVARGAMDLMIEAEIKIWDIAAATLLVEEAGGRVTDITGKKVTQNTKSIIASNGLIHDEIVTMFNVS